VDTAGLARLLEPIKFRGANLDPASNGVLDDLAAILRAPNAPARVTIQAFAQPGGAAPALTATTQRRADAVKAALVTRQVPAERIEATGMGGQNPVAPGNSAAARRQNERVEVKFTR
jgi:outer membrane protein OmpA-like peptidoglycan-associated protein